MTLSRKPDKTKAEILMESKKYSNLAEAQEDRRAFWGRFYDDQKKYEDFKPTLKREDWITAKLIQDGF